ncbi:MAG: tRNA 4-thiouridine(8) synthase ThiI [Nitrososphaerales archaeon]|nr:tRNA 4-thiouridine(8) synthase ThiI [Nitrososphaerales archaeon]
MPSTYVVHYSEIALKGKNRPEFARVLRRNIRRAMATASEVEVESSDGRYLVETAAGESEVERRLSRVFGVAWFAKASVTPANYSSISSTVVEAARGDAGTFMVAARRSDKSFPIGSVELARRLGGDVVVATNRKVDLTDPSTTIHVDVLKGRALVYSAKVRGPGGLPVGTAGKVMHLFSGGIDSPVAAWLLMKRGCQPVYLHFYSAPDAEYALKSKVARIVRLLTEYSGRSNLLLMPFADYQVATSDAPADAEPSLFRRFMRMTAESLAPRFSASAVSTGDSLSQAASQTLWNIAVFDSGSSLPILRPVLGYDKEEIVQLGKKIGTYEPSVEEYRDCCSIVTRHPKTRVKAELIEDCSKHFDFQRLVARCVSMGTLATFDNRREAPSVTPLRELTDTPQLRLGGKQ